MAIIAKKIDSKYFSFHAADEHGNPIFITEASDLPAGTNFQSQVYDDACDEGFTIVSEKTGDEVTFAGSGTDYSGAGSDDVEIAGWRFSIVAESVRKFPRLANLSVLIIND